MAASIGQAWATNYFVVVPNPGRSATSGVTVSLSAYSLPAAHINTPYAGFDLRTLLTVKGDSTFNGSGVTWSISSGSLPAGLSLSSSGLIGGTPTEAGSKDFTVRATYRAKNGENSYQIFVANVTVTLSTATLPAAKAGTAYAGYDFKPLLQADGQSVVDTTNATFTSSGLPAGLSLSTDGLLTGTPTTKNVDGAMFSVAATYKTATGQQAYKLVINNQYLDAVKVFSGGMAQHACALTPAGKLMCWGLNGSGQLGNGTNTSSTPPTVVSGLSGAVLDVVMGAQHTCALLSGGVVNCWGGNTYGQLGNGTTTNSLVPVPVAGISGASSIAANGYTTCAIVAGGLRCWGQNWYGQFANGTTTDSSTPVASTVVTSGLTSIALGGSSIYAINSSGALLAWGDNLYGQLGNGTNTASQQPTVVTGLSSGVRRVVAGNAYACAVTASGTVSCWGFNNDGELGNGTMSASYLPVSVSGVSGATAISAGTSHTCAIANGGVLACWGLGTSGQLGNGASATSSFPVAVTGLSQQPSSLALGQNFGCVVDNGSARCVGYGRFNRLGNGSQTNSPTLVGVANPL